MGTGVRDDVPVDKDDDVDSVAEGEENEDGSADDGEEDEDMVVIECSGNVKHPAG